MVVAAPLVATVSDNTGTAEPSSPDEMTLTVRTVGSATVTVGDRERREIAAELGTADDWPTATRDVIAMSEACKAALGELPLHATVTVSGAVAWAGRLDNEQNRADDLAALPMEPPGTPPPVVTQPEARIGPCPLHAGEDHTQVRTWGNWMCALSLRGLDDGYTILAGLADGVRHVIDRYEAEELNAMTAFGEIEKLFAGK